MRSTRPYTYLGTIQGMCRQCRQTVPCRVVEREGAVYQERLCPTCGTASARIADDVKWYVERMQTTARCTPVRPAGKPVSKGCPHDCGPCAFHANACHLPVFSITNACNMACPICFTFNRGDRRYFMSREELRKLLDGVIERSGTLDLINITGGEPTLHPQLLGLLEECARPEIGRITLNSNGFRLSQDEEFCRELAARGVYVILSLDTLASDRSVTIHGRDVVQMKLKALENLQRFGIGTTLLNVMIRGVNEDEIGRIIGLARSHDVVRSITVQTMTFTGQGGRSFGPRDHLPLDGCAAAIEKFTDGQMRQRHFIAHPGAHPMCYSIAYFLKDGPRYRAFTEFLTIEEFRDMLTGGYLLQPTGQCDAILKSAMDRRWAQGADDGLLARFKELITSLYPPQKPLTRFERQRVAEERILTVYLHAHMDEDTLDLGRLCVCPDQVPDPEGRMIPACAYNLFFRMNDPRFYVACDTET